MGEWLAAARPAARPAERAGAGEHDQEVSSQRGELLFQNGLGALAGRHGHDERAHAYDHAQRGQQRAHEVAPERAEREWNDGGERSQAAFSGIAARSAAASWGTCFLSDRIRPSRTTTSRSA